MRFVPTKEQANIIDHVKNNYGILMIEAGAGCSKTSTSIRIIEELKPEKCLYTAFNKAIVEDSRAKMEPLGVECKTFHALAYQFIKPRRNINEMTYTCITEDISYGEKYRVISAINSFYVSDSSDMYDYLDKEFEDDVDLKNIAVKYINAMIEGDIDPSFGFLLKFFHLMLLEGTVNVAYDLIILDEINDVTGVALEIFKLIKAPRKIGLGETDQAIYGFLNLVNGFEVLKNEPKLPLTKSFRCSSDIARKIQNFMRAYVNMDFTFVGTDETKGNGKTLYCTRTNSSAIRYIADMQRLGKGYTLLRKPSEIFACPLALTSASSGKPVYDRRYKFLEKEYTKYKKSNYKTFTAYLAENVDDKEIESAIRLLATLRSQNINIFTVYKKCKEDKPCPKTTIATVFTAKGLEFETVYIADDLNKSVMSALEDEEMTDLERITELRCYYVATSRAQKNLIGADIFKPN